MPQREESIKQEKLASLTTLFMESVIKYKNLDIHLKAKSKTKLVNAIKITGVSFSEKEIEEKIEDYELDSFLFGSTTQETDEARKQMGEVRERHEELK